MSKVTIDCFTGAECFKTHQRCRVVHVCNASLFGLASARVADLFCPRRPEGDFEFNDQQHSRKISIMKRNILFSATILLASSLLAADSSPKDDVTNAAKKLAAKDN